MEEKPTVTSIDQLKDGVFYRFVDLKAILASLGLHFSIFFIRNMETWKCTNYRCGKRFAEEASVCTKCGSSVRPPVIPSPRSVGGVRGFGHRRYTAEDIRNIVDVLSKRY